MYLVSACTYKFVYTIFHLNKIDLTTTAPSHNLYVCMYVSLLTEAIATEEGNLF